MADTTARPEDVDIGQLGSMFGVQTRSEPDYLEYDIRGRGYMERLFFNCGASYLGFMLGGGVYGTVQGLRLAPANAPLRVRTNALMNGFGKHFRIVPRLYHICWSVDGLLLRRTESVHSNY